jgi:alpha-L-rhamnosidase
MKNSKWIWCPQNAPDAYNQTVLFKKDFSLENPESGRLLITADSWYRVSVNGKWIHDGPARAYPAHFQYDEHDLSGLLKAGKNRIEVIARYFGCGTFHQIPQQAGLRAELHTKDTVIGTDSSWLAAPSKAWKQWTPKISIQMEPVEEYDARLEKVLDWQPAVEVKRPGSLTPRNTGLLTRIPRRPQLRSATLVKRSASQFAVPVTQIAHPDLVEANGYTSRPVILGAVLSVRTKQTFDFSSKEWKTAVAGRRLKSGKVTLNPGRHTVLFFCTSFYGHNKELVFPWLNLPGAAWSGWTAAVAGEFLFRDNDRRWFSFEHKEAKAVQDGWNLWILAQAGKWKNPGTPFPLPAQQTGLPENRIFLEDPAAEFAARQPLRSADRLLKGNTIEPSRQGDVELCYDFGGQTCGYFDFSIEADDGVLIDLNAVEYIAPGETVQHTLPFNRNGMRYITRKGANRFTSLKRRAGRYLFLTLRNQKTPVRIKTVRIIESTAPVRPAGSFFCSDPLLTRIWGISERTLQLCMEDTFTDCPLYEQTLWIGDARNEALYAFTAYGSTDVSARSIELGAQSLEQLPMVGCQVPSSWDCLLPAWSFLWGLHVWEHYFYSGDKRFLKKMWPAVVKNLEGARQYTDRHGLFSGPLWNLLEWAPIDHDNQTVLHNSMLLTGALRAAALCAETLGEEKAAAQFEARRKKLVRTLNAFWDSRRNAYPDALLDTNGEPSPKVCQHTSMLAIMCDIATPSIRKKALANLLQPPAGMTPASSPFAMQFLYEALEKAGEHDALIASMREKFAPMIDAQADTVWEIFPGADFNTHGFPTRSHCHAWSSSPLWFLPRIILGIRQTAPGGKAFEISPWIGGLHYASGATATPTGLVAVEWKIRGDTLLITVTAPKGVKTTFVPNDSHKNRQLKIVLH